MSELKIITYPNKILKKKSQELKELSEDVIQLALNMIETMYNNNGIGLAAPQVNELKKIIIVDIDYTNDEGIKQINMPQTLDDIVNHKTCMVLINPIILETSNEIQEYIEGCLSIPGFNEVVKRPQKARISATLLNNKNIEINAEGIISSCLQHEIDHLSGILFIDRISSLKRNMIRKKISKNIKEVKNAKR